MSLDERDLARLGEQDMDVDELPETPWTAPPVDDGQDEPTPRRRGRPPASPPTPNRARTGRVATLKDRMAALRQAKPESAEQGPALSTEPTSGPVLSTEQPAEPAQEQPMSTATEKRISHGEAAAILGCTPQNIGKLRDAGKITSGELGTVDGMTGKSWTYLDSEIRGIARARQAAPKEAAARYEEKRRAREAKQRDPKPEKAAADPAPARAAQPARSVVKPKVKPRPVPPSPVPAAEASEVRGSERFFPAFGLMQALAQAADARVISYAKLDRVLAVLLEG